MDLKLIERFLSAMMPAKGKASVHTAFECMRADPGTAIPSVGMMIGRVQHQLYSDDEAIQAAACGQLLTGIMIAWSSESPALRKYILEDYLERDALLRGENVISFFDKKAGR